MGTACEGPIVAKVWCGEAQRGSPDCFAIGVAQRQEATQDRRIACGTLERPTTVYCQGLRHSRPWFLRLRRPGCTATWGTPSALARPHLNPALFRREWESWRGG